jgi:molybdate transport system substrate-binding protein
LTQIPQRPRIARRAFVLALVLLVAPLQARELVVSVAVSLHPAVAEIAEIYRERFPEVETALSSAASGVLLQQVLRGAPVDLFISAAPGELDRLAAEGLLVEQSRRALASNRLVVLLPPDGAPMQSLSEMTDEDFGLIAVGNPKTAPVGRYTQQALSALELSAAVEDRLIPAESARHVVVWVQRGEVAAGVGYRTDAWLFADKIRLGPELPEQSHAPIEYQAAVLSAARQPEAARQFVDLLLSPRGREVLERYGFLPPP